MNKQFLVVGKQKTRYLLEVDGDKIVFQAAVDFIRTKTPIYVGDFVEIDSNSRQITKIIQRSNFLIRPPVANIDQVLVVMSLVEPEFSLLLVEKFLAYTHFADVRPILVLTKKDKVDTSATIKKVEDLLLFLGVKYFIVSSFAPADLAPIQAIIKNKKTALMGQTGVGKSTLINNLFVDFDREVGEYSSHLGRGRHTTKEIIMLKTKLGYIVDTPGFSSFELPMIKSELAENYPGFAPYLGKCYFNDCLHLSEHHCQIKQAVVQGLIKQESYDNYVKISNELTSKREDY